MVGVYNASADRLTPALAAKFNVLKGLDIPYRIGHHRGGQLGNFADVDAAFLPGVNYAAYQVATIDQVMAYSNGVYTPEDLDRRMTHRSFNLVSGRFSQNFTSPSSRSGDVVQQPHQRDNLPLYEHLFNPASAYNGVNQTILDRVKSGYDRLRRHPRLSRGDAIRLDQHVERMFEIERKLAVANRVDDLPPQPAVSSTDHSGNHSFWHNANRNIAYCDLMADMVVAAFSTGVSRVATWDANNTHFTDETINDWHGQVAHGSLGADASQALTVGHNQGVFEHVMVAVARKLDDVQAADGQTPARSQSHSIHKRGGPIYPPHGLCELSNCDRWRCRWLFSDGLFVDYTNKAIVYPDLDVRIAGNPSYQAESPGLYYNQWLAKCPLCDGCRGG